MVLYWHNFNVCVCVCVCVCACMCVYRGGPLACKSASLPRGWGQSSGPDQGRCPPHTGGLEGAGPVQARARGGPACSTSWCLNCVGCVTRTLSNMLPKMLDTSAALSWQALFQCGHSRMHQCHPAGHPGCGRGCPWRWTPWSMGSASRAILTPRVCETCSARPSSDRARPLCMRLPTPSEGTLQPHYFLCKYVCFLADSYNQWIHRHTLTHSVIVRTKNPVSVDVCN